MPRGIRHLSHGVTTHTADSRRLARGCAPARRPARRMHYQDLSARLSGSGARSSRFPLGASQERSDRARKAIDRRHHFGRGFYTFSSAPTQPRSLPANGKSTGGRRGRFRQEPQGRTACPSGIKDRQDIRTIIAARPVPRQRANALSYVKMLQELEAAIFRRVQSARARNRPETIRELRASMAAKRSTEKEMAVMRRHNSRLFDHEGSFHEGPVAAVEDSQAGTRAR